jgi:hypothetical protein
MYDLNTKLLEQYKPKLDEIIERVKVEKHIILCSIDETWVNITVLQQYLRDKCIENGLHVDKQMKFNECVIYIDSL